MTDFDALVRKARKTNARRDADERAAGWATPADGLLDLRIRTVCDALEAGMRVRDWDCVAEGFVMLQAIERTVRDG